MHIVEVTNEGYTCTCGMKHTVALGESAMTDAYEHCEKNTPSSLRDMRVKPVAVVNMFKKEE